MPYRNHTWSERQPYPPASREKYGASTPSLGAHEEHTDLVEETHPAAPTTAEIRRRQQQDHQDPALRPIPRYLGFGQSS